MRDPGEGKAFFPSKAYSYERLRGIKRDQKLNCCKILGEAIVIVVNGALIWIAKLQDASREFRELGKRNDRDMAASKVFLKAFSTQTATDAPPTKDLASHHALYLPYSCGREINHALIRFYRLGTSGTLGFPPIRGLVARYLLAEC